MYIPVTQFGFVSGAALIRTMAGASHFSDGAALIRTNQPCKVGRQQGQIMGNENTTSSFARLHRADTRAPLVISHEPGFHRAGLALSAEKAITWETKNLNLNP
jgi:hypothetical protein